MKKSAKSEKIKQKVKKYFKNEKIFKKIKKIACSM